MSHNVNEVMIAAGAAGLAFWAVKGWAIDRMEDFSERPTEEMARIRRLRKWRHAASNAEMEQYKDLLGKDLRNIRPYRYDPTFEAALMSVPGNAEHVYNPELVWIRGVRGGNPSSGEFWRMRTMKFDKSNQLPNDSIILSPSLACELGYSDLNGTVYPQFRPAPAADALMSTSNYNKIMRVNVSVAGVELTLPAVVMKLSNQKSKVIIGPQKILRELLYRKGLQLADFPPATWP